MCVCVVQLRVRVCVCVFVGVGTQTRGVWGAVTAVEPGLGTAGKEGDGDRKVSIATSGSPSLLSAEMGQEGYKMGGREEKC